MLFAVCFWIFDGTRNDFVVLQFVFGFLMEEKAKTTILHNSHSKLHKYNSNSALNYDAKKIRRWCRLLRRDHPSLEQR